VGQDISGAHEVWHVGPVPEEADTWSALGLCLDDSGRVAWTARDEKYCVRDLGEQSPESTDSCLYTLLLIKSGHAKDKRYPWADREYGPYSQSPVSSRSA
jgi:hypothetical protein